MGPYGRRIFNRWHRKPRDHCIRNKQSQTTYKGWSSRLEVRREANSSTQKKKMLQNIGQGVGFGRIVWNNVRQRSGNLRPAGRKPNNLCVE
jgi:hypothetical protein